MSKTILVTGSRGYLGPNVTQLLREDGYSVSECDLNWFRPGMERSRSSFTDVSCLEQFDVVIHLAALSNDAICDADPIAALRTNHSATIDFAARCRRAG